MKTFHELYASGEYSKAREVLEQGRDLLPEGLWHYNLGTVLAKMEKWSLSRYHFILAEKNGFNTSDLIQNKKYVEEKIGVYTLERSEAPVDYLVKTSLIFSEGVFTTLGLVFILFALWNVRLKEFKQSLIFFVIALVPLSLNEWVDRWPKGLTESSVTLYQAPSKAFGASGEIPEGVLLVTNRYENWYKVIYPARFSGWIKGDGLLFLESK